MSRKCARKMSVLYGHDAKVKETAGLLNVVFEAMETLSFLEFLKWMKENSIIERINSFSV